MSLNVNVINSMTNATDADLYAPSTDRIATPGVWKSDLYTTPMQVVASNTPDTNSNVNTGVAYIADNPSAPTIYYRIESNATETQAHDATTSNPRIDAVVLFLDTGATPGADGEGVATIEIVKGAESASPTAPTDGDIDTQLGDNTWIRLADIAIANPFSTIQNSDITDYREFVGVYQDSNQVVYHKADINGNIQVFANQISSNIANPEETRLVEVIVPSGFANAGNINEAIDLLDTATTQGTVTLLPGSHFVEEPVVLSGGITMRGCGQYASEIESSSGTWSGTELVEITSDECSITDLSIKGAPSGLTHLVEFNNNDECRMQNVQLYSGSGSVYGFHIGTSGIQNKIDVNMGGSILPFEIEGDKNVVNYTCKNNGSGGTVSGDYNLIMGVTDVATTDTGTGNNTSSEVVF